ncbi:MAG: [protein-PII] uridylyltransferase [bacterium]|nr:[protein-PII] uridylyltransferase [bacterium]
MSDEPALDQFIPPYTSGEERESRATAEAARGYLGELRAFLAERQRQGDSGNAVNVLHSDAIDRLLRRLFEVAEFTYYADEGEFDARVSIAAVGGFARREMAIGSDVDLLFLHDGDEVSPYAARIAEWIQYCLWDAGLEVGAALRNLDETIAMGQEDLTAKTTVLGARFLAGDATLFHEFTTAVRDRLIPDVGAFVQELQELWQARHSKFGDSLYLLQPNIKEGAGGLRDYHTAWWAVRATEPRFQGLDDLLHVGLLTESEMAQYRNGLQFLWRVRNQLHLSTKRKTDQMSFELQESLAERLGLGLGPGPGGELPVERFMREYYLHARAVQTFSEIVLEQCAARTRPNRGTSETKPAEDGFRVAVDHLEIPHAAHLRENPVRLLTAFAIAQDHDVPLSRTARRYIREHLHLIDEDFQKDPEAAAALLRILGAPTRVMRTLMVMNEVGLLGRYLPEWEHIVCRWQHVIYHTYTVDVHSIFLVEELRRLWRGKYEQALPELTELVRNVPDLPALYLGCLLHDIGKGMGGDHSNKGADMAEQCCERLGLDADRTRRVVFVVRWHLLMSHVAQRRDLADPKVIVDLAQTCGDRENLHNLYLATFADMRASSTSAWTEWRYELLKELFERTSEFLESGGDDPRFAQSQIDARVETRRAQAARELQALGVAEARVHEFFEMMPRRYFISHTPRQIARHARVVLSLGPERAQASAVRTMRGGFSEYILCTRDARRLYSDVAGSLTAVGINILGSNVYTTRTGLALEIYRVSTPDGGEAEQQVTWDRLEEVVADVLQGRALVDTLIAQRGRPVGRPQSPSRAPAHVQIRNDVSDFYTVVDVTADDRPGLLYDLTRTLAGHDLEIFISKATTVLDQVADTFYIKGPAAKKITNPDDLVELEDELTLAARGEAQATEEPRNGS